MRFHYRKRRQAPAIIIVALIDILIVLLIFLMVTSTFKQQNTLKISLPESSHPEKSGATETPPLVVTIEPKGTFRLGPDNRPVTSDRLKSELLAAIEKDPTTRLAINADTNAPVGQFMKVYDAAREAKVKVINMQVKEPVK